MIKLITLVSFLAPAMSFLSLKMAESSGGGATILDLDSMMDIEMDKVETLPDYVTPPAGIYMLAVEECKIEKYKAKDAKDKEEKSRIRLTYKVEKTVETDDLPVKDGSLFSETFMGTEEGLKYFKKQAMNILNVKDLDGARLKDVMEGLKGQTFKCRLTIKKTPGDNGATYENVQVRPVHEAAA